MVYGHYLPNQKEYSVVLEIIKRECILEKVLEICEEATEALHGKRKFFQHRIAN